jgi:hypothetical protein
LPVNSEVLIHLKNIEIPDVNNYYKYYSNLETNYFVIYCYFLVSY